MLHRSNHGATWPTAFGDASGCLAASASSIRYSWFAWIPSTRVTPPSRQRTSNVIGPVPAANVRKGSLPLRYCPPPTISCSCFTGPPSRRTRAPIAWTFGRRPRNRTATRGAVPRFRYTNGGPSMHATTTSRSPSPSRSAKAVPWAGRLDWNPHASETSSKVPSRRFRSATFAASMGG